MKVICSGMPKTGTKTLSAALTILGYNVYDFDEQFWYLGDELSKACNDGCKIDDLRRIFKNVDAATDVPAAALWEELHWAFPDAKIVHTERRDEDEYEKSYLKQVAAMTENFFLRLVANATPTGRRLKAYLNDSMRIQFGVPPYALFSAVRPNTMIARKAYRQHNSRVRAAVPSDKVLFFKLTDGWGPLCKFLDKPIPSQPFPHRNKGGEIMQEKVEKSYVFIQIKKELQIVITIFIVVIALLWYFYKW